MQIELKEIKISFTYTSDENEDIKRCLETLFQTPAGTIPLDRDFGLSYDIDSMPLNVAQNEFAVEITEKVEKYEPRVAVERVDFEMTEDGLMSAEVILRNG